MMRHHEVNYVYLFLMDVDLDADQKRFFGYDYNENGRRSIDYHLLVTTRDVNSWPWR